MKDEENCVYDPDDNDPCLDCDFPCDAWEARYCCTKCRYDYGDIEPPCEDCDRWDI